MTAQMIDTSLLDGSGASIWITVLLGLIAFGLMVVVPLVGYAYNNAQQQRKRAEIAELGKLSVTIDALNASIKNLEGWTEKLETRIETMMRDRGALAERISGAEHRIGMLEHTVRTEGTP